MLDDEAHVRDCGLLGIAPNARPGEVERTWRDLKAICAENSLATYGLLEEAERQEMLESMEGAYGRIVRRLTRMATDQKVAFADREGERTPQLSPMESVGPFLRNVRERSGLSLQEVARRTKISPMRLEQIEKEMFERLPAAVYLRGFVLEYAKALGFPQPQEVAGLYLTRYQANVPNP